MLQKNNLDDAGSLARETPRLFVLKRLESTCDAFEASWKERDGGPAGGPDLRDFLGKHDFPDSELFLELLQIDMVYRRRIGLPTALDDYARRFPEYGDVLQKVGSQPDLIAEPVTPGVRPDVPERYRLEEELGQGSFGVVWKAWDTRMGRPVALKCLRHDLSPAGFDLLEREANAVSQMSHPNVVRALDAGRGGRGTFIVFELVDGISLQEWAASRTAAGADHAPRQPGHENEIARIVLEICRGLQHIHDQGVIHRDLKPGNILVTRDGSPKIIDFGLSKYENVLSTLTGSNGEGALLGTVPYMSPEQCLGRPLVAATDIYSLGVILYELLTGERPFEGGTREELVQKIIHAPAPRFDRHPGVSPPLKSICLNAMNRSLAARYQSASTMADDLERFLQSRPVSRRRGNARAFFKQRPAAWKTGIAAVGLSIAGLVAHLAGLFSFAGPRGKPAVIVETFPPGATLSVIPVDRAAGRLHPDRMLRPSGKSPVSVDLPPGDYLIVAALDDGRFHEVYRHVPHESEAPAGISAFRHLRWVVEPGGDIRLPAIEIPAAAVTNGMVRVDGTGEFQSGVAGSTINPAASCRIPTFFVDAQEFSLKDYQAVLGGRVPSNSPEFQPRSSDGAVCVTFEEAVARAENAGKRLLEEAEFEFVSTARGESRFPWGNEPLPKGAESKSDRFTNGSGDIFKLCSGHAEWTDTARMIPGQSMPTVVLGATFPFLRSIRGGGAKALESPGNWMAEDRDPRLRTLVAQFKVHPGAGFRCARSPAPRLTPKDFVVAVPTDTRLARTDREPVGIAQHP